LSPGPHPRRGTRHAPARGSLPPRHGYAVRRDWSAGAGPHRVVRGHRDVHVDGHDLLAAPGRGGAGAGGGPVMDYDAVLTQVLALLQQEHRIAYRILKRRLQLDDERVAL